MTDPAPGIGAEVPPPTGVDAPPGEGFARGVLSTVHRYRWFLLAVLLYLLPVLVISRFEIVAGPGQFPQGTNALNAVLHYHQMKVYPLQTWYAPFTDWGLPVSGYTGPSVVYLGTLTLDPSTLTRVLELGALWASGLTAYILLRQLGANVWGALTAGFYYMLMAETPHFFEGHVPFMISLAIAPIYLLAVYRFGSTFRLGWGLLLALTLYLLASIGDLGCLYFLLFFGIPLFVFSVVRSRSYRAFGGSKISATLGAVALFVVLMAPWWLPYALGSRPQYFTGITVTVAPFWQLRAQPLDLAFVGISIENSFSRIALGPSTYAVDYALLAPLFYVVPIAIALYVIVKRTVGRILLYLGGWLAILISTGPRYPGVASLNDFLYTQVPYFDYIPLLPSWLAIAMIVYTVFVGWLVSDLVAWSWRGPAPQGADSSAPATWDETGAESGDPEEAPRRKAPAGRGGWGRPAGPRPATRVVAVAVCLLFVLVSVGLENGELLSSPPQYFQFPSDYLSGFNYIQSQPAQGGVLTVPFSAIYERTPWGGVSASSQVMAPYFTNANSVVFEAGTPYSLAMDWLVWYGLSKGYTNNLTKFLEGTNVQYVAATNYSDWAYSSSSLGSPRLQYENLYRQVGLGSPVFENGRQSVYDLGPPAGNLSFHPGYIVYFGGASLVNEITNQPFYNGTQVLVNGSSVDGSLLATLVPHASLLVYSPATLATTSPALLATAEADEVPIVLISGASDASPGLGHLTSEPWNSSNAVAIKPPDQYLLPYAFNQSLLLGSGTTSVNATLRVSCPPGGLLNLVNGATKYPLSYPDSVTFEPLSIPNGSVVSANIANGGAYPYNGSVTWVPTANGAYYLLWNITAQNSTYQYLHFDLHNLTGDDGLTFTVVGQRGLPPAFQLQLLFNGTYVDIPSYASVPGPGPTGVSYSFLFRNAVGPGANSFEQYLGDLQGFNVGTYKAGIASDFNITSLSFLRAYTGSPFHLFDVPSVALIPSSTIDVYTSAQCRIDTLAFQVGTSPTTVPGVTSYRGSQSDPLDLRATSTASGWGILVAGDTYSPIWQLSLNGTPAGTHLVANLGLNGWLVNLTRGDQLTVRYLAQQYQSDGILIEVVGLPLVAVGVLLLVSARSRARLRKWLRRSPGPPPGGDGPEVASSSAPGPPGNERT